MHVILVARDQEFASLLQYHLKPLGLEVDLRTDPAAMLSEMEGVEPLIVLCRVQDFPRHWKPLLAHLRYFRSRSEAVFVLLAQNDLPPEEAAKATHLEANGIVAEDVTDKRGTQHLLDILRRYQLLHDKRGFTRYALTEADRVGLAFVNPLSGVLVTGEVTEISAKGLSFAPSRAELTASLREGAELPRCSLRLGERIVTVGCQIMRAAQDLGLQFLSFEEGAHGVLRTYIQERPDRALRAALEAGRRAAPSPDSAAPEGAR